MAAQKRGPLGLVHDTGALIAAERNDRRMWALHQRALARGVRPVVPAGCIVEAWAGSQKVALTRLLDGCTIEPLSAESAKRAGTVRARSKSSASAVDATVVEQTIRTRAAVLTSDRGDLESTASGSNRQMHIIDI